MRKHAHWYTAGYPVSAKFRAEMSEIESYEELKKLMENYLTKTVHGRKIE